MTGSRIREEVLELARTSVSSREGNPVDKLGIIMARRILLLEAAIVEHCEASPKKSDLKHFDGLGLSSSRLSFSGPPIAGSAVRQPLTAGGWSVF